MQNAVVVKETVCLCVRFPVDRLKSRIMKSPEHKVVFGDVKRSIFMNQGRSQ